MSKRRRLGLDLVPGALGLLIQQTQFHSFIQTRIARQLLYSIWVMQKEGTQCLPSGSSQPSDGSRFIPALAGLNMKGA